MDFNMNFELNFDMRLVRFATHYNLATTARLMSFDCIRNEAIDVAITPTRIQRTKLMLIKKAMEFMRPIYVTSMADISIVIK